MMKQLLAVISLVLCADYVITQDAVTLSSCPSGSKVNLGYILSGTQATCTCSKASGSLSGQVTWYFESNNTDILSDNDDVVLTIVPDDGSVENYRCDLNPPGPGSAVTFEPKVAYGPTSVTLTAQNTADDAFNQCPNGPGLTIECSVQSAVNPPPSFKVRWQYPGEKETILISDPAQPAIQYEANLPRLRVGKVDIICEASSLVFPSELNVNNNLTLTVNEPPSSYPVISINARNKQEFSGNDTAIVIENDALDVSCEVTGGSPVVDNVTLTCGPSKTVTTPGTSAQLQFDASRRTIAQSCSCQAGHVTGCYDLVTTITIDSVYQPEMNTFTANGQTELKTLNRGDQVRFLCKVDANPEPKLSIVRRRNTEASSIFTTQGLELDETIENIQCDQTDRYYCVADNGIQSSVDPTQKSVDIYVQCTPSLLDPSLEGKTYEVSTGQNLTIHLGIVGYPSPDSYGLSVNRQTHQDDIDTSRYSVSTPSTSEPTPGVVTTLVLYNIQSSDLVSYTLTLSNGQGSGLTYTFTVAEKKDDDSTLYIGIGVGVGVLLIIVIVIIVVVIICRRRSRSNGLSSSDKKKSKGTGQANQVRVYHTPGPPSKNEDYPYDPVNDNGRRPSFAKSTKSNHTYVTPTTDEELYEEIPDNPEHDYITPLPGNPRNPRPHNMGLSNQPQGHPRANPTRGGYMGPQGHRGQYRGF